MMKKTKSAVMLFSTAAFIAVLSLLFAACPGAIIDPPKTPVESITIDQGETLVLGIGEGAELDVIISPDNADNKNVEWTSSNEDVVTISEDGQVTAVAKGGPVLVTAKATDGSGKYDFIKVYVTDSHILVESVSINGGDITLQTGTSADLIVTVVPAYAANRNVTWSSSNEDVVIIVDQNGRIEALAEGTAIVKATAADGSGMYDEIEVSVTDEDPIPVDSVSINGGNLSLSVGMSESLSVTVLPLDAGNKNVRWESSAPGIVTVTQIGYISALAVGDAIITATAMDGSEQSDSITVTVSDGGGGGGGDEGEIIAPPDEGTIVSGDVIIIEAQGWLETLFVKWEKLQGAATYNVYYRGGAVSAWTKIDDPLVREYGTYFRADILGLAAGTYEVKVHYVDSTGEGTDPATAQNISVLAHDRSGFAFKNGAVPGAYKADGTPKDGARILYITNSNKDTVSLSIKTSSKGAETTFTGLDAIVETGMQKGYETRPLIVRFIGKINEKRGSPFTDNEGTVMIKDNGKNNNKTSYVTMEGVGDDATAYGWGFRTSKASNVEIRNIGFMLANTSQKDAVELQNSTNMWVHNCDFFYMKPGSASDQKKGDGTLDVKECNLVTISYNHFWDAGKTNLLGNGTETAGSLTYHHNWYDHSDSRNPRVRCHQVHVYNNYYDGIAKYGIGATMASSIFAEGNYFRNTNRPMMISMQGTDIAGSTGTFSSEAGGIIKAYNNYMDTPSQVRYRPWSASNTVEFDAYEVQSAGQSVPSTVRTKKGGTAYNNFDANLGYTYTVDTPQVAKQNVETWSGRYWGGDFSFAFNNATDDALSDDPMPGLLAALNAYTSGLVSIQGESGGGGDGGGDGGGSGGDDGGGEGGGAIEGDVVCTFTSAGGSNPLFAISGNVSSSKGTVTVNGTTYTHCLKMESSTNISFTIGAPMTLKLVFGNTTEAAAGKKVKVNGTNQTIGQDAILIMPLAAGTHAITKGDTINLFYIALSE